MTREEAIEKVRQWSLPKDTREILEALVPELAESEDERIRKWILEKVQEYADSGFPRSDEIQMANKAITYLEKQKEHKHPNGCFTCDEYKKGYESGRSNGFTAGYNKAMKEVEQKEQKPVEWSEEDERIIAALTKALIGSDSAEKIMLFDGVTIEMVSDWLKSLRPQSKQEWSEEDKNRHYYLRKLLRETWNKVDKGSCIDDAITWFEKLPGRIFRPSWKPSEEQMEALEKTTRLANFGSDAKRRDALLSLYEQLKRLI